jgi:hypothetical protein
MTHQLTKAHIVMLEDFCDEYEYSFYNAYSGRGMNGRCCVGFVSENNESEWSIAMALVNYCYENENDALMDIFKEVDSRTDSMGMNKIIYFPSISDAYEL